MVVKHPKKQELYITDNAFDDYMGLYPAGTMLGLKDLLKTMAPITHPMGDKRNGDVVFRVIGTHLRSVSHIDDKVSAYELKLLCGTCGGRGMLVFYDECPLCSTTGCPSCEKGLVKVRRKCPDKLCGSKQTNKGNRHAKHQIQNKQNGRHHSRRTVQK